LETYIQLMKMLDIEEAIVNKNPIHIEIMKRIHAELSKKKHWVHPDEPDLKTLSREELIEYMDKRLLRD
jgi:hypothetical protein